MASNNGVTIKGEKVDNYYGHLTIKNKRAGKNVTYTLTTPIGMGTISSLSVNNGTGNIRKYNMRNITEKYGAAKLFRLTSKSLHNINSISPSSNIRQQFSKIADNYEKKESERKHAWSEYNLNKINLTNMDTIVNKGKTFRQAEDKLYSIFIQLPEYIAFIKARDEFNNSERDIYNMADDIYMFRSPTNVDKAKTDLNTDINSKLKDYSNNPKNTNKRAALDKEIQKIKDVLDKANSYYNTIIELNKITPIPSSVKGLINDNIKRAERKKNLWSKTYQDILNRYNEISKTSNSTPLAILTNKSPFRISENYTETVPYPKGRSPIGTSVQQVRTALEKKRSMKQSYKNNFNTVNNSSKVNGGKRKTRKVMRRRY
jgi:hypothetical protein